jgi:hypothetical protein
MMRSVVLAVLAAASLAGSAQAAETCDRQIIMRIDSAQVTVKADGVTIDAFGVAESAGWSKPTLVIASTDGATATADYVACRPEVSAQVLTPVYTRVTLPVAATVTKIVIRTKTNSMDVEITRR